MRWRVFFFGCLVILGLVAYDEERRLKTVRQLMQRMHDKWSDSPVESR